MKLTTHVGEQDPATVERGLQHLREYLRQRGLRSSSVREVIARAALGIDGHFNVDTLVQRLTTPHLSTVYRVLRLLLEAGLLQEAPSDGDWQCFERAFERGHHDHLLCSRCGYMVEFKSEVMDALERDVAQQFRFVVTSHVHHIYGVCERCSKAQASEHDSPRHSVRGGVTAPRR